MRDTGHDPWSRPGAVRALLPSILGQPCPDHDAPQGQPCYRLGENGGTGVCGARIRAWSSR